MSVRGVGERPQLRSWLTHRTPSAMTIALRFRHQTTAATAGKGKGRVRGKKRKLRQEAIEVAKADTFTVNTKDARPSAPF